ncbi:MAG: hypothetical protein V4438_03215 [Patescibacteria group bacterium]
MGKWKGQKNNLTAKEQKTTATFKLMSEKNKTLERSLKITQDELEKYREKYHESDKNHAVQKSKNQTIIFHEILKYISSALVGGVGVNYLTNGQYKLGSVLIVVSLIFYTLIVFSDRK